MDTSSIYPKVREIVADVLAIEEDDVKPEGSLIDDYGGESIDFLDLVYRLEREFKVKIKVNSSSVINEVIAVAHITQRVYD